MRVDAVRIVLGMAVLAAGCTGGTIRSGDDDDDVVDGGDDVVDARDQPGEIDARPGEEADAAAPTDGATGPLRCRGQALPSTAPDPLQLGGIVETVGIAGTAPA